MTLYCFTLRKLMPIFDNSKQNFPILLLNYKWRKMLFIKLTNKHFKSIVRKTYFLFNKRQLVFSFS